MARSFAQVRDGRPEDAADLAALHEEAWRNAYQGLIPETHLARMMASRNAPYWRGLAKRKNALLVLEAGGVVAGYATLGRARSRGPYQGEIYELYLAPVYQGLGFGELLFEGARARLEESGREGLVVWALTDNASAARFYENRGGRPAGKARQIFGDRSLEKIAYGFI